MDLMESSAFNSHIILLQTVLEEVRHRSLPLFSRLKALVKAEDKHIWVFYNEYRSSVYPGLLGEDHWLTGFLGKLQSFATKVKLLMTGMTEVSFHLSDTLLL